jgi:CheY-like chemotaxis protein
MIDHRRTVLLVEDHADDEELTIRGLRRAHLKNRVAVAHDGQEAVDYLFGDDRQAAKPVPAVVLLDLKLPRLGGLDVLKRIRTTERDGFATTIEQLGVYWLDINQPPPHEHTQEEERHDGNLPAAAH